MSYTSGSQTDFHHRYQSSGSRKYRYKVLEGALRERIRTMIGQVWKELDVQMVSGVLSREHDTYVRRNPAAYCRQRLRAARRGTVIASGTDGVPGLA